MLFLKIVVFMLLIKESTKSRLSRSSAPNRAIENLLRIRLNNKRGIDLLEEHDIKFVYRDEKADFGISKYGDNVKGVLNQNCILWKNEPPIYNVFWGRELCNPKYLQKFKAVMSCYEYEGLDQVHYITPLPVFEYIDVFFDKPKPELLCTILKNKQTAVRLNNLIPNQKQFSKRSLMDYRTLMDNKFCDKLDGKYHSYGRGWKPKCFKGEVSTYTDKYALISQYKFNFCPENSWFNGYVTEKPIVSMCCGSIPIYWGAPDVERYLPKGTFIDATQFESNALCDYVRDMSEAEYNGYRKQIKAFLKSDKVEVFSSVRFAEKLIKILEV